MLWAAGQISWAVYANGFENWGEQTLAEVQNANYAWFVINLFFMLLWLHTAKPVATSLDKPKRKTA